MKKSCIPLILTLFMFGCTNNQVSENVVSKEPKSENTYTTIATTATTKEITVTADQRPVEEYGAYIKQKMIFKDKYDNYFLFVLYFFKNDSGKTLAFYDICSDYVYLDGIQCDHNLKEYDLDGGRSILPADPYDKVMSGNIVSVTIGYSLKNYNPDKEHEFVIQLTEPFAPNNVIAEETKTSDRIQLRDWKDD